MNLFAISSLLVAATNLLMATLVLSKRQKERFHVIWGWFCLLIVIWGIGGYKFSTAKLEVDALFWWQIAYITPIFAPVMYSHFVCEYLKIKTKFFFPALYALAGIFLFFTFFAGKLFLGDLRFTFGEFYTLDWMKYKNPLWLIFYIGFSMYTS